MEEFFNWCAEYAYPGIRDFMKPLSAWIGLAFVATFLDFKLSYELYGINRKKHQRPKFRRYFNKMLNCFLLVILAGYCRLTIGAELGVTIVSTVVLIAFSCFEVTKCVNKFMLIENTGKKIDLFKLFKGTRIHSVIEDDNEKLSGDAETDNQNT